MEKIGSACASAAAVLLIHTASEGPAGLVTAPHSEYREKLLGGTEATSSRGAALTVYRRLFLQRDHFRTRASHPDRPCYIWLTSSVQTLKPTSVLGPKVWVIGTSAASRP